MRQVKISERIHYVGTNDRKKHLFENNWPLPNGVSYNSYLINDEKTALIDTLEYGSEDGYIDSIRGILAGKALDYLIVNHMEPDHASMIGEILRNFPGVKVVANCKTFGMLEAYYRLRKEDFLEIKEGDILDLGHHKLTFVMVPWVHWPETMVTYDTVEQILFSCDAFGSFGTLDGGIFDDEVNFERYYEDDMRRYYSNIVGKYSNMVQKAFAKLANVPVKTICPSHGLIWRTDPAKVLGLYDRWSRNESEEGVVIAYASMYGNTEKMADAFARELALQGIKNIRVYDVSKTHVSYILSEIWKYKGLVLGTCAYNGDMHPMMHMLCHEIGVSKPQNKTFAVFGSSTWNGCGVKSLISFAEKEGLVPVGEPVQVLGASTDEKMSGFAKLAEEFAARLKA